MRLPAHLRIKASRDFARIKKEGTSHPGRFIVLSVLRDPAVDTFRFGLITTRKLGPAVVRNKIRRRIREVIREQQMKLLPGVMMVIIGRWRSPDATLEELQKDWLKVAARAGILKPRVPQ